MSRIRVRDARLELLESMELEVAHLHRRTRLLEAVAEAARPFNRTRNVTNREVFALADAIAALDAKPEEAAE